MSRTLIPLPAEHHDDVRVLILQKGKDRYIFLFTDENKADTLRTFGRFAANPDLSFNWYDAAQLSQRVRSEPTS